MRTRGKLLATKLACSTGLGEGIDGSLLVSDRSFLSLFAALDLSLLILLVEGFCFSVDLGFSVDFRRPIGVRPRTATGVFLAGTIFLASGVLIEFLPYFLCFFGRALGLSRP